MARIFGTDGVRGVANTELSCPLAFALGQAAVRFLGNNILIGRDTRRSGDALEASLAAGVMSAGGSVWYAGIIPTPGIALLTREMHADGGVVISASHNPPEYNGIKFFDAQGFKLPDEVEDQMQEFVEKGGLAADEAPTGQNVGIGIELEDSCDMYINHVVSRIEAQGINFEGLHVALDTAHGASSLTSAEALRRLGAEVTVINDDFDGSDINVACGSTCLDPLKELMSETDAHIGIAHDGDADRVMMLTPSGEVIDGDIVEAVCALDLKKRNELPFDTVVSTVMCNLGLTKAMEAAGITVVQTKVGDRYVLEEMREHGYVIGGEQSGHMILLEHNSTGDGLMTACQFIAAVMRSGKTFSEAISAMKRFPQSLINVRVADKSKLNDSAEIWSAIEKEEQALKGQGRVLVRPSGTEPVVRVMVEAPTEEVAEGVAERIAKIVEDTLV